MPTTPRRPPAGALLRTAAALLAGLAACGAPRAPQIALPDAAGPGCDVGAAPVADGAGRRAGPDTLWIAAPGPLEGRRPPVPASRAERIAYRHLYGTLVEVDCRGRVEPGLASSWSAGDAGRRWTFRLRRAAPGDVGADTGRAAVERDGEDVAVSVRRPLATPALFADPRFAVTGDGPPFGLPRGTGSHTPATTDAGPDGAGWVLAPRGGAGPVLRVVGHRGGAAGAGPRPRDLLDRGVDLVVTRRPAARRYAASLPEYAVEPLPWDRTYVLLVPALAPDEAAAEPGDAGGGDPADAGRSDPGPLGGGDGRPRVLRDLARDAVRADARASRPPHWWGASCGADGRGAAGDSVPRASRLARPSSGSSARLLYPEGDPTAEELAARLAALSGPGGDPAEAGVLAPSLDAARGASPRLRPVGVAPDRFDESLGDGRDGGYVLALPRRALAPCWSRDGLGRRAPWLTAGGARLLPLVDTRLHLAVRRGVAGFRLDWDGVPRLAAPVAPAAGRAP